MTSAEYKIHTIQQKAIYIPIYYTLPQIEEMNSYLIKKKLIIKNPNSKTNSLKTPPRD